ncbi:hypothetical protein HPB48_020535 [Haemaphysalis longicornis]|uniref:Uncharacterized protein n=1 Tax=Haemaphysalis longicornis TaxID=44386 RepID=A0A9J6G722_HAELO|nr:hypothetical protein HPB48_020535 [Haemaphysalis longicornis]
MREGEKNDKKNETDRSERRGAKRQDANKNSYLSPSRAGGALLLTNAVAQIDAGSGRESESPTAERRRRRQCRRNSRESETRATKKKKKKRGAPADGERRRDESARRTITSW